MARSWQEIVELPEFQQLKPEEQESLRNEYFRYYVAPSIETPDLDAARATFDAETAPRTERTWGEALADTGLQLAEGGLNIVGAPVSLLAPESDVAAGLEGAGDWLRQQQSLVLRNKMREADARVQAAGEEGFLPQLWTGLKEYGTDPALAMRFIATTAPSFVPVLGAAKLAQAGTLTRGLAQGLAKEEAVRRAAMAGLTAAGATNAVLNAGGARQEAYADIRQTLIDQGIDPLVAEQIAMEDSRLPAAVGGIAGAISGSMGLEPAFAGRALGQGGWRAGGAALGAELAGEQVEELTPQATTNLMAGQYDQREITQNLGQTAAQTLIGSAPGGVVAGYMAKRGDGTEAGPGETPPGAPPETETPPSPTPGTPPTVPPVTPPTPSGTLERAAGAGAVAAGAGLGTTPAPSPEEVAQVQAQAMQEQQQAEQQQQKVAQEALKEQERQTLAAEKLRQEQLKTRKAEIALLTTMGLPGPDAGLSTRTTEPGAFDWRQQLNPPTPTSEVSTNGQEAMPGQAPNAQPPTAVTTPTEPGVPAPGATPRSGKSVDQLLEEAKASIAARQQFITNNANRPFSAPTKDGTATIMVTPSAKQPGRWQVTRFDEQNPSNDSQASSYADAVQVANQYQADWNQVTLEDDVSPATGQVTGQDTGQPASEPVEPPPPQNRVQGMREEDIPLDQLTLSPEVPQFKLGANKEGVVEPLGGTFDPVGVAPIQVWERMDGRLEVISGGHRLDLARRSGMPTIRAQVHREADGFDVGKAMVLDATLNIRDGQGKVIDYVDYFKNQKLSRDDAKTQGLVAINPGKRAFELANSASAETIAALRAGADAGGISDTDAEAIVTTAPNDDAIQALGLDQIINRGVSAKQAIATMQAAQAIRAERQATASQGDMFGFDDTAIKEAVAMGKIAASKKQQIQTDLSAITGAAKRPEVAARYGVDVKDNNALANAIQAMRARKIAWDTWQTNPELVDEVRQELRGQAPSAPAAPAVQKPVQVPTATTTPATDDFTLTPETEEQVRAREEAQRQREQAEEEARQAEEARARADRQRDIFALSGSNLPADQAVAAGQMNLLGGMTTAKATEPKPAATTATKPDKTEAKGTESTTDQQPSASDDGRATILEPGALYSGYEVTEDERRNSIVSDRRKRSVSVPSAQLAFALDNAPSVQVNLAQQRDNFFVRYEHVATGELLSGTDTITSFEDAAHVLAPIRKHAQEAFYVAVTDAKGKILDVQLHTKGTRDGSSVFPEVLIPAVVSVPGAAKVWFAHNHPSGITTPSNADQTITSKLTGMFNDAGLEVAGHVVLGQGQQAHALQPDGRFTNNVYPIQIKPMARKQRIAITERKIRQRPINQRPAINGPDMAIDLISGLSGKHVVVLLNNRHQPVGTIDMTEGEMQRLKSNQQVKRLLTGIDRTNASAVLLKSTNLDAANNVARMITQVTGVRVLDAIINEQIPGTLSHFDSKFWSAQTANLVASGGPWFSKAARSSPATFKKGDRVRIGSTYTGGAGKVAGKEGVVASKWSSTHYLVTVEGLGTFGVDASEMEPLGPRQRFTRISVSENQQRVQEYVNANELALDRAGWRYAQPGETFQRVVWDAVGDGTLEPNLLSAVGLEPGENVAALHVTSEPENWATQLEEDYDRFGRYRIITIEAMEGDIVVEDVQQVIPSETFGRKLDSGILVTGRPLLKRRSDKVYFSQGEQGAIGLTPATARTRLNNLLGAKTAKALLDSGILRLVNRGADYQGATFADGQMVLNLDALDEGTFDGVTGHEGFHSTIRDLLGTETYGQVMERLSGLLKADTAWVKQAKARVPDDTAARNVTEEVGAYAIEDYLNGDQQPALLRRWAEGFLSALRTAIIRHLPNGRLKNWALANLQARDLARLAIAGLRAKARAQRQGAGMSPGLAGAQFSQAGAGQPTRNPGELPRAARQVSGLTVLDDVPNQDSIGASLESYDILPGIREVPLSAFPGAAADQMFYAADDFQRVDRLAKEIKASGEIKPLIVVYDNEGPYVLEGGHRLAALHKLGVESIPAMVVMDTSEESGVQPANMPATIDVDGQQRPTRNSEGRLIHPTAEGVRAFWRLFGDSEITDNKGRPILITNVASLKRGDDSSSGNSDNSADSIKAPSRLSQIYSLFQVPLKNGSSYGRVDSDGQQSASNGRSSAANKFGYFVGAKPIVPQPSNIVGGNVVSGLVNPNVIGVGDSNKVFNSVVSPIPIFVMDVNGFIEQDSGRFLENNPMVEDLLSVDGNNLVSVSGASSLSSYVVTVGRTEESRISGEFAWPNEKTDSTNSAIDLGFHGVSSSGTPFTVVDFQTVVNPTNPDIRFSLSPNQAQTPPAPPAETRFRQAQRVVQDKFNRFRVVQDWLKEQGITLSESADVYRAEERFHARVANQIEDFREQTLKPLIAKSQQAGFKMADIAQFLHAQHAEERNEAIAKINDRFPDGGSGMATQEARDILAAASPELKRIANAWRKIADESLDMKVQAGLITPEMADAFRNKYQHYVPLKGGPEDQAIFGTGKGLKVRHKEQRALGHPVREGGEWIIEQMLNDRERTIMKAEKAVIARHVLQMALEMQRPDIISVSKPKRRQVLKKNTAYVVTFHGTPVESFTSLEAAHIHLREAVSKTGRSNSDFDIIRSSDPQVVLMASPMLAENEIMVYEAGHEIRLQLNDDLLARAYANLGQEALGPILRAGRVLNTYLSKAYTSYNPEFLLVNLMRDFTTGIANLSGEQGMKVALRAVKRYPRAFMDLLRHARDPAKDTQSIRDYRADGGNTGAAYLDDLERVGTDVAAEYAKMQGVMSNVREGNYRSAITAAIGEVLKPFISWIEKLNQAGENAMRLSIYQAMRDSGLGRVAAASAAKNTTVNFNRKGELGLAMNAWWLFFNASVQGTAAIAHAHFKGAHKGQAWAFSGSLVGTLYLASLLAAGDEDEDDEYEKISEYDRSRNLIIRTGSGFVKLPIPYGYGFFANLGRGLADAQRTGEIGKLPWHLATSFIEEFTPFGAMVAGKNPDLQQAVTFLGPTAWQIAAAPAYNRTSFGTPLYPEQPFKTAEFDRDQMWRGTKGTWADELAGALEQAGLDVSPETLKHLWRTGTGGAGAFVSGVADVVQLKARGADDLDVREVPLLRKFATVPDVQEARSRYYEAVEEAKAAKETFSRFKKLGRFEEMATYQRENRALISMAAVADATSKRIKRARDFYDAVKLNPKLPLAAKRRQLRSMALNEMRIYDGFVRMFQRRTRMAAQ